MKFETLEIKNFKAIRHVLLDNLPDVVVIAGPNGSGKSTVFDAIRFWKSTIGSYQQNELQQWLNELGMSNSKEGILVAHQDKNIPFEVKATISLAKIEVDSILANLESLLAFYIYKRQTNTHPMSPSVMSMQNLDLIEDFRIRKEQTLAQVRQIIGSVAAEIQGSVLAGAVSVAPNSTVRVAASEALKFILSVPGIVGTIEYHGPQRLFGRESVSSLNLNIESQIKEQKYTNALYNSGSRYSNVKTELASAFVRKLIADRAGNNESSDIELEQSIEQLFTQFIPGKRFAGIQPTKDGNLTFNVETAAGLHDISDLSSGEKELIYGYLRLRNSGTKHSVIMIDEPELHLNPRLVDGLPDFYYRHIGRPLANQLWLVTHSDTILRQSTGFDGFKVYHMRTVGTFDTSVGDRQLVEVTVQTELDRAIVELVGDLAGFKPGGKIVLLEGGGQTQFDRRVIERLFPDFVQRVNLASSESKQRVQALHRTLLDIGAEHDLFDAVFSITDADGSWLDLDAAKPEGWFEWDCYHIENYLVEPHFIHRVMADNNIIGEDVKQSTIYGWLQQAAASTKQAIVNHEIEAYVRKRLQKAVRVAANPGKGNPIGWLSSVIDGVPAKIDALRNDNLSVDSIRALADELESKLTFALDNGDWLSKFRGRDVLLSFVDARCSGRLSYDALRWQIIARMRDVEYQPIGMGRVLAAIDAA